MKSSQANPPDPSVPASTARLLLLAGVIARNPGITLAELVTAVRNGSPGPDRASGHSRASVARSLASLKTLGFLEDRPHRRGYFLAGRPFTAGELSLLLNGLRMQAEDLLSHRARMVAEALVGRLVRGLEGSDALTYPVVAVLTRVLPQVGAEFGERMDALWSGIQDGRAAEIIQLRSPWERRGSRTYNVWPLQFVFHDRAWYLLAETNGDAEREFRTFRLDRLSPAVALLGERRSLALQRSRLALAKQHLDQGWGVVVPSRAGLEDPVQIQLHFDAWAAGFLDDRLLRKRHPTQRILRRHPTQDLAPGEIVFEVRLPDDPWVIEEFSRWVAAWRHHAVVLEPEELRRRIGGDFETAARSYRAARTDGDGE